MKGNAPERLVSGSDDFTMFLWEPFVSKHPKTRMTGHQQVQIFHNQLSVFNCHLNCFSFLGVRDYFFSLAFHLFYLSDFD